MTPEELLRLLADPERLAIAGALARGARTQSELVEELGLPAHRVRRHLAKLAAYIPGQVKKKGTRDKLLVAYQHDPVFSIFGPHVNAAKSSRQRT